MKMCKPSQQGLTNRPRYTGKIAEIYNMNTPLGREHC